MAKSADTIIDQDLNEATFIGIGMSKKSPTGKKRKKRKKTVRAPSQVSRQLDSSAVQYDNLVSPTLLPRARVDEQSGLFRLTALIDNGPKSTLERAGFDSPLSAEDAEEDVEYSDPLRNKYGKDELHKLQAAGINESSGR